MSPTSPLEGDDMTMNELWIRIRRMGLKIWSRTTRRIRVALAMAIFLYVFSETGKHPTVQWSFSPI